MVIISPVTSSVKFESSRGNNDNNNNDGNKSNNNNIIQALREGRTPRRVAEAVKVEGCLNGALGILSRR